MVVINTLKISKLNTFGEYFAILGMIPEKYRLLDNFPRSLNISRNFSAKKNLIIIFCCRVMNFFCFRWSLIPRTPPYCIIHVTVMCHVLCPPYTFCIFIIPHTHNVFLLPTPHSKMMCIGG